MKKFIGIIGAVALIALIYYCISYIHSPVSTLSAYSVTHEEAFSCDAYIVRDETVYESPSSGSFYSYAREGARIGRNRRMCAVYSAAVSSEVLKELGTIDTKLAELSTSVASDEQFLSDGGSAENRIIVTEQKIDEAAAQNDVLKIAGYKAELKAIAAGEVQSSKATALAELTAQKESLESQIKGPREEIYSTASGIYSMNVDGYERILTPSEAMKMTVSDFLSVKPEEKQPSPSPQPEKDDKEYVPDINRGDKICKIVDNHEWYILALAKKADLEDLKVGSSVSVRFGKLPGEQTPAVIQNISNEDPQQERAVVLLKCESYSEGAFSIRYSDIEIIKRSYSGFQVPVHAVRVVDGQSGVMVRVGGKEVFRPCEVIFRNDAEDLAIITPSGSDTGKMLSQYDLIVLGEK